jgi:outer membrane receptor protein involved in Fe transport
MRNYLVPALCCAGLFGLVARLPAQSPTATASTADQAVKMNPFEVQADSDTSYGALNSNAITRFSTDLNKMPISADIFDQAFMDDVGTDQMGIEGLIESYSAGAGFATSDPASSAGSTQPGDRNGNSYIQIRGLSAPSMQRDGLMLVGTFLNPGAAGVGFSSTFDIERVEIVMGPQALLYGAGGGGGVINTVSKQARLGKPAFGSARFQVDQYGNKLGQLDYGAGTDRYAVRFSMLQQNVSGRRVGVGGPLEGYYGQFAVKLGDRTTMRVVAENTTYDRVNSASPTLTAASTSNDARNGQKLHYLLATNQLNAAADGRASGAGPIVNGLINWDNVDSLYGWQAREITINTYTSITADTVWSKNFSTEIAVGYDRYFDDRVNNTITLYAPNNTSNPLGVWALGETGGSPMSDTTEPSRTKGIRASALLTNELFGDRGHSQTNFGADFVRGDQGQITYDYFVADNNFNLVSGGPLTTNGGHTIVPKLYWPIDQGRLAYPLWEVAGQKQVTYNGVNYVRAIQNPVNTALVSPSNPVGVTGSGGHYIQQKIINKGLFAVNNTDWGKLDTLVGFRLQSSLENTYQEGTNPFLSATSKAFNFDVGANYAVLPWLRPYFAVSDSINPPLVQATDPYGAQPVTARALGEEVGVKTQSADGRISGSLAFYHTYSKNEEYLITTTLVQDINPSGLNGHAGNSGNWINVPRTAQGVQLTLDAAPSTNLRLRLSAAYTDGKIGGTTSYNQLYNDQFNADKNGNVTYADGTVVYVPATFNSKNTSLTVDPTTPGAIPLTIAQMNSSSSAYYANPVAVNGQINSGSNAAKVLATTNAFTAAHGSILTGKVGLPISSIQINPGFTPPGEIVTSKSGDSTTGYSTYSVVLTDVYTFNSGWAKGFRIGQTLQLGWQNRRFYDYSQGIFPGAPRTLFYFPQTFNINLIAGYTRKFHRVTWSTQLNVDNLFNHYHVVITPNPTQGYTGVLDATFDQQPRNYIWSNTISF